MSKILVVEDNAGLSDAYSILLKKEGFEIALAGNGNQALHQAKVFQPDLILLDLFMPKSSGLDFLKAYRSEQQPRARIIVLTNVGLLQPELKAGKLGVQRYLIKSQHSPEELLRIIRAELKAATAKTPHRSA